MLSHRRGCYEASPIGDKIVAQLLEECEGGDLTTDCSDADDARGTLRAPLILQPVILNWLQQKLSPVRAATIYPW